MPFSSCFRRTANRGRSLLPLAVAFAIACGLAAAAATTAAAPVNQTYLVAVRIRRRFGFTLGCHDSLHTRGGYEFSTLEAAVCSLLRKAAAGTPAAYSAAALQPWFAVQNCRADRFLCDQGLPLAQVALTLRASSAGAVSMAELRLRFRSAAHADDTEMLVDQLQIMDYNECGSEDLNDCSLNAVCQNRPGGYECRCKAGFVDRSAPSGQSGKACVPLCGQGYCANGGLCVDAAGAGECRCAAGYWGRTCEATAAEAAEAPGHRRALVMALASLSLTVAVAAFLVLWYRARSRRGAFAGSLRADACATAASCPAAAGSHAGPQHYPQLLRGSDAYAPKYSLR